jgi:hypothetical protein
VDFLFEFVFQLAGELLLQVLVEALVELGCHSLSDAFKRPRHPILSSIGFAIWGAIAGVLSLLIVPHSLVADPSLRVANLAITPTVAGLVMMGIGRIRDRKGQEVLRIDRFGYAFLFAFSMALVRFAWNH